MKHLCLVIVFLLLQYTLQQQSVANSYLETQSTITFPKILWTYWASGYEQASLLTKLCINNLAHFATASGWRFNFLTRQNYTLALSAQNLKRMQKMISSSKQSIIIQQFADILRIFLLQQHGGMWIDTNSFFLGELHWINQLYTDPLVYNRITSEPSVLTFTYNQKVGGNKSTLIDTNTNQSVYLFPGIQVWAMAAKANSIFFTDLLNTLEQLLTRGYAQISAQNSKKGLKFDNENIPYFFFSNYMFQMVLQLKQKQLQQQNFNQLAVQYYQIWSIEAAHSALMIPLIQQQFPVLITQTFLKQSLQTWKQKHNLPPYFVKLTGQYYPFVNIAIKYSQALSCLDINMTVQPDSIYHQFLYKPSRQKPELAPYLELVPQSDNCSLFDNYFDSMRTALMLIFCFVSFVVILCHYVCWKMISNRRIQQKHKMAQRNDY